jgi:D-alanyl-D-alanine dipeptidase
MEGTFMSLVNVVKLSLKYCQYPIQAKLKYATNRNFVGRPIDGYKAIDVALMTSKAARKLCAVQNSLLKNYGYGLIVYDAYRPRRAIEDFIWWSKQPVSNLYELERKIKHYPNIEKYQLFDLGYVSKDSGHCYGNTVDLFLIDIKGNKKMDMGSRYDYMDERSHLTSNAEEIGEEAYRNRQILLEAMQKFDFEAYSKEFWHFSHQGKNGREVQTPMDMEITPEMKELLKD